jgi:CubicO group peptidase (beta-lactamase class C family)
MRSRIRWVVLLALLLVLGGGLSWWWFRGGTTDHDLTTPDHVEDVFSAIGDVVPTAQVGAHVPGVAVAVAQDGTVAWSRSFGVPDGTVFQAGSISKTVAAATVLALADRGLLDLDTPVSAYLRSWRLPTDWPDPDAVTLRHLLSHTAGIDTSGYLGWPAGRPMPSTAQSLSGADTGAPVRQSKPIGEYSYSGGGYTIVQQAVEDVTGEPFADVVRREVLVPLGMSSSGYGCTQSAVPSPVDATGHLDDGKPAPRYRYAESAAAGFCTTADDLAKLAGWLGSSDPRAEEMRTPAAGTGGRYGLGVELMSSTTVGHVGVNRGFHAELLVNPDDGLGLAVLTDGDGGGDVVDAVIEAWHDAD